MATERRGMCHALYLAVGFCVGVFDVGSRFIVVWEAGLEREGPLNHRPPWVPHSKGRFTEPVVRGLLAWYAANSIGDTAYSGP